MTRKIVVVGTGNNAFARAVSARLIAEVEVIAIEELGTTEQDPWGIIEPPKPLGNERTGKRKAGKSRYEPPKFG